MKPKLTHFFLAVSLVVFLFSCSSPSAKHLGYWEVMGTKEDAMEHDDDNFILEFKLDGTIINLDEEEEMEEDDKTTIKYKIDYETDPIQLDLYRYEGKIRDTMRCLVEFTQNDSNFYIYHNREGSSRPNDFNSERSIFLRKTSPKD